MKKSYIFISIICALFAASCDKLFPKPQAPAPKIETRSEEKVKANLDVDIKATEALKLDLLAKFPETTPTETIESALKAKGFDCNIDPTKKEDRACTNLESKNDCIIMTIVRTLPYTPNGAQVIKGCKIIE